MVSVHCVLSCTRPACMSWRERAAGTRSLCEPLGGLGDPRTEIPEFHFQTQFGAPWRAPVRRAEQGSLCTARRNAFDLVLPVSRSRSARRAGLAARRGVP